MRQLRPNHIITNLASRAAAVLLATALPLAGCGADSTTSEVTCADALAPGTTSIFAANVGPSEGIAFLEGAMFISGGTGMRRIAPDGTSTRIGNLPGTIGMAAWKGALYVASQSDGGPSAFCAPTNRGVIWKMTTAGDATIFARGFVSPNFVAVTPWDTLLVSDSCPSNNSIFEVDASGNVTTWFSGITSPNGMGFNPAYNELFVVNTFIRTPSLSRIPVRPDHRAGMASEARPLPTGSTPDGMAVDADGNAYVALNILNTVRRIAPDLTESDFATGVVTPASLTFGAGPQFDPCSMYATSLTGQDITRIVVGRPGVPLAPES